MNVSQGYIDGRISGAKPSHAWVGGSPEQIAEWQDRTRTRIRQLLGIEAFEACEPDIRFEAETVQEGLRRRALTFATRSGYRAFAYLLEPVEERDAGPAILCIPGHGAGVDAIVGLADEPYQAQFALEYARAGYRALALEPFGFGHRKSSRNPEQPFSCGADSMAALMLGETLAGWRVWDAMRAIDVLRALPGVHPDRIGIAGISGGGLVSLWTAALDVRIKACVVSGYFCTFRDSILAVDHCPDNFVPGILRVLEMPDFAGLVAPRSLFVESGTEDPIFPIAGFRRAVDKAKTLYAELNAEEEFGSVEFEGDHHFNGKSASVFLRLKL